MSATAMEGRPAWPLVLGAGVALGVAYTLSPLTVLCLPLLAWAVYRTGCGLDQRERRWFFTIVTVAIVVRLIVLAGLFLSADESRPYATLFGDEELFKSRTVWLRNIGLDVPISRADIIYAFDDTGRSGYLYVLAYLQALVGDAPYGVHVLNTMYYVLAVLLLFRLVRPAYGPLVGLGGVVVLLYLPSLSVWSVSALKEPMHVAASVLELACLIMVVRAPRWWQRVLAALGVVAGAVVVEGIRRGTIVVVVMGAALGLTAALLVGRPRASAAAMLALPLVAAVILTRPAVQDRVLTLVREGARYHVGHVLTPGTSYQALDPLYYKEYGRVASLPAPEAARFVVRATANVLTAPLPWTVESTAMLAYMPEQLAWYILVLLAPFGVVAGMRRDSLLTCVLAAHAAAVVLLLAMTGGNIGTLIRHRGLALPYLVWLSILGARALLERARPVTGPPLEG